MNAPAIWKVVHTRDAIETVYLVEAESRRGAETAVLDALYAREHRVKIAPERLANDPMGLLAASQVQSWTNAALCRKHGCSVNAAPFNVETPYRLYALDTRTGVLS